MAEERDLPWGDPHAHWTPEQHQDWADAEAELYAQGYRPRANDIEVLDTVAPAGIGRWGWICTESNFELPDCTTIDLALTAAELRLADREVRGLADDEDRAAVAELRRARGRLN
ncbi:hypothetical protein ACFYTF_30995 [Nocardia thailandica]|uniref:Transposase n=1 Tax=Nocardia thailandica TaxID=257275 RepID=A0ABW6PY39_9NOCA